MGLHYGPPLAFHIIEQQAGRGLEKNPRGLGFQVHQSPYQLEPRLTKGSFIRDYVGVNDRGS